MSKSEFEIVIANNSVDVRLNVSPKTRFYALLFFIGFTALLMCLLLFGPGKHGNPSMWQGLSSSPANSGGFIFPLVIVLSFPLLMTLFSWRYVLAAYPSNQTVHCDRSTLTVSKVRWFDIHNNDWNIHSYQLADIVRVRYQSVGREKSASIYGLRLTAGGKKLRILPGLEATDAARILEAFKSLGVDVDDDPESFKATSPTL
jgi:Zn-dependent protease with chaperone function